MHDPIVMGLNSEIGENTDVKIIVRDGQVVMAFSKSCDWISFPPEITEQFANKLIEAAKLAHNQIQ